MSECKKCGKIFRDRCDLGRHQSRSRPCTEFCQEIGDDTLEKNLQEQSKNLQEQSKNLQEQSKNLQKQSRNLQKQSSPFSLKCEFCLNTFSSKYTKKRHLVNCKIKEDPIRLLEIQCSVEPELPDTKTECRFCNKIYNNISNLNKHLNMCEDRKEYHGRLINQITNINNNNCNNTNCNNTVNTINCINNGMVNNIIHINVLGQENTEHIETENIINLLRDIRKEFGENQASLMAGTFIDSFDKYIRENPENQNIIIPHHKSTFGTIQTGQGWKKMSTDRCLNRAFKSSANELYNRKEEIDNHNKQVFKSATNKQIFSEVKQFGITGLEGNSDEIRQIKTSFKIGKLKEIEINF